MGLMCLLQLQKLQQAKFFFEKSVCFFVVLKQKKHV